jgi:uncharacterized membrane protein
MLFESFVVCVIVLANAMLFSTSHHNKQLLSLNKKIGEQLFKAIPGIYKTNLLLLLCLTAIVCE